MPDERMIGKEKTRQSESKNNLKLSVYKLLNVSDILCLSNLDIGIELLHNVCALTLSLNTKTT